MDTAKNDTTAKDEIQPIFKGVTYYTNGSISQKVIELLNKYGAKRDRYLSDMVSHVIADSKTDDYSEAKELFELPIVKSDWVVLSVYCGVQLPKETFALEGRIFSDVVACPFELSKEDADSLWCMLTYHGAKCQLKLDENVTHLITAATDGVKYLKALEHSEKMKVITPDWVVDSITKGAKEEESIYHPCLLEYPKPEPETPLTPPKQEVMDAIDSSNMTNASLHGGKILDDNSRPDTPTAKEALARKITHKMYTQFTKSPSEPSTPERATPLHQMYGKSPSEPTTPERAAGLPHFIGSPGGARSPGAARSPGLSRSPGMTHGGPRNSSPVSAMAMQPGGGNIRNTLRNITNRAPVPGAPGSSSLHRAAVPTASAKMPPMMGMGMPPQVRPPPPDYPFPPRAAPPQPPLGQVSGATTSSTGSTYFGHDPKENVPPDFCLLGCVFCVVDYGNLLGNTEVSAWKQVIENFGGQLESSYCHRVTHVLCSNQKSDVFKMAIKEGKRVVTAFWLNDCLLQKKMMPPWQALHLPLSFNSEKPGAKQNITVTNFDGEERLRLKQMINAIGAKYTGYMTHHNSALICKKPGGMKFEKAKEWRIAVVNVQWLSDLVLGNMDALRLPVHVRYLQVGQGREFHMDLARVTHLMGGWKTPVRIHKDTWKRVGPAIMASAGQENTSKCPTPPKRQKVDTQSPQPTVEVGVPKVMFTLYPKSQVAQLENAVKSLGGVVVSNPRHCTHLVCPSLARTIKFFVAINCCHHVLTKDWVLASRDTGRFIEESRFSLKDEKGEADMGCDISESIKRARTKPLFQGLSFYISPSTVPPVCELTSIIESAGGAVVKKRPSAKHIAALMDEKCPKFLVITCNNDLHLCQDLHSRNISVYNAEFVLSGVMRQELDFKNFIITRP